jgi:hypothetical protein
VKPAPPLLEFLRQPAPRPLPSRDAVNYATRSHRHMVTVVVGLCFSLWLLSVCFASPGPKRSFTDVVLISTMVWGFFAVVGGVPAWLHGRSTVRRILHLLRHGELATGTVQLRSYVKHRKPIASVAVRSGSTSITLSLRLIGRDVQELRSGDVVHVLLANDLERRGVGALVTEAEFCVGSVDSFAGGPRTPRSAKASRGPLEVPPRSS